MGDADCDLLNEKTCPSAASNSSFIRNLSELFSLSHLICESTRVMLSISTLINHISITCIDGIIESGVHKVTTILFFVNEK